MKILMLVMALIFAAPAVHGYETRVDGSWFDSGCFGCPGDTVINEVIQQNAEYHEANDALVGNRSDENLKECLRLAPFSFLKAAHALELGDRARKAGDKVSAKEWYDKCLAFCATAKAMPLNEKFKGDAGNNIPKQSRKEGAMWETFANEGISKIK